MSEISVIVPVYKVEKYLAHCVDSILCQSYTDFDLILIDDGSPDSCGSICDKYAAKDPRVHVIHQKNGGLSAARNAGIDWVFENSGSSWLTFIDSDDWIHPQYLEILYHAAAEDGTEISLGQLAWTHGEPLPEQLDPTSKIWKTSDYYRADTVNATVAVGKLYLKTCFEDIRYPVGKLHEDEFVTYRILFRYERISVVEQPIYAYYQNDESIMNRSWRPARLDGIDALEQQVQFFLDRGDEDIARMRFQALLYNVSVHQDKVLESRDLSAKERRYYARMLRRKLRGYLFRYRKYKWVSLKNDRPLYASASAVLGGARRIWLKIKPYVKHQ